MKTKTKKKSKLLQKQHQVTSPREPREIWLQSVQNSTGGFSGHHVYKPGNFSHKTQQEFWTNSLRKSSGQSGKQSFWPGQPRPADADMAYTGTSNFLRQQMGMVGNNKRRTPTSHSQDSHNVRQSAGTPAYKSPEEYYDEILELKKEIRTLTQENRLMRGNARRLEEEAQKRQREVEQLLDPVKSDDLRRTICDRRADSSAVIHSLKQKIMRLELSLKEKESTLAKLQSDLKTTRIDEMKVQMEMYYTEMQRLRGGGAGVDKSPSVRRDGGGTSKEVAVRFKQNIQALNDTIRKLNEQNVGLQAENRELKSDLERSLDNATKDGKIKKEYEDMSRLQLLSAIRGLEKRLERAESDSTAAMVAPAESKNDVQGKIALKGTLSERLAQLDARETELIREVERLQNLVKRLDKDRREFRRSSDEKDKKIKQLEREMEFLQQQQQQSGASKRKPSLASFRRKMDERVETRREAPSEDEIQKRRRTHAARVIQRSWRSRHPHAPATPAAAETDSPATDWGRKAPDDAVRQLQSVLRGHVSRTEHLATAEGESKVESSAKTVREDNSLIVLLQSTLRGHRRRSQWMEEPRLSSRSGLSESADETDEGSEERASPAVPPRAPPRGTDRRVHSRERSEPRVPRRRPSPPAAAAAGDAYGPDEDSDRPVEHHSKLACLAPMIKCSPGRGKSTTDNKGKAPSEAPLPPPRPQDHSANTDDFDDDDDVMF